MDLIALYDLLKQQRIKPLIVQRFPLAEARHAHELLGKGDVIGKIVLVCNGASLESGGSVTAACTRDASAWELFCLDIGDRNRMKDLIVHQINIAHYRLIELTKLADQAKPFYDWVERHAKRVTGSHKNLNEILLGCSKAQIDTIIRDCYSNSADDKPFLFDGIGRVYPHVKACFYFFAWIIRDAPQQRLSPLITRMKKADQVSKFVAETDTLVELIFEYRGVVKSFEWQAVREVVLDRLEGSRRSSSGHRLEAARGYGSGNRETPRRKVVASQK